MRSVFTFSLLVAAVPVLCQTPDWSKVNPEAMRHFQALVQIDTTDPPGNETRVVDYVKKVLEAEGMPGIVAAKDPARANLIVRLKGNRGLLHGLATRKGDAIDFVGPACGCDLVGDILDLTR